MWLIKLPFRILAIPVFLVAFLILIVIKLLSLSRESGGRSGDIDCGRRNYFLYLQNAVDESVPVGLGRSHGSGCDVLRHNHWDDDGTDLHRNRRFYSLLKNKYKEQMHMSCQPAALFSCNGNRASRACRSSICWRREA